MKLEQQLRIVYQSYRNKSYIEAEIAVRKLLGQHPENSDVLRLGALTALSINQVVTAQSRLRQACLYCELTAEIANTMGNILKASGEWVLAEEAYKKALSLDKNYKPTKENFIDLLVISGQPDRAFAEINSQIKVNNDSDFLKLARASALIKLGRYEEALSDVNNINEAYEPHKVAELKVRLYFHLKRYEDMRKLAETIPEVSEHSANAIAVSVNAHAMQDNWPVCRDIIHSASEKPAAQAAVFVNSIQHLTRGGFSKAAEKLRNEAQLRFERNADILSEKASHYMKKGDYFGSCALYKEALSMRPGDFSIMLNYAQASLSAGQYDLCQTLIEGALRQAPNNQFLFALAAVLKRKRGQPYNDLYDYDNFIRVYDLIPDDGFETIEQFNTVLKTCLKTHHYFQSEPLNQSLRGGTQTNTDLSFIDDPILKSFFKMIKSPILDYMSHIGNELNHPLKRRNTGKYRLNGAWSVNLTPEGHHVNHVHPMGWLSSSYYVDVPDVVDTSTGHEGWIKFGEPGIPNLNLQAEKFVQPKAGRLVLFPSYMWHGTVPFSGNQSRLTLPFDVVPA